MSIVLGTVENYDEESGFWLDDFEVFYDGVSWTYVSSSDPDYVLWFGRYNSQPDLGYIRFTLGGAIPSGAVINSAKVKLWSGEVDDNIIEVWAYSTESSDSASIGNGVTDQRPTWADGGGITTYPTVPEGGGAGHWTGIWPAAEDPIEIDVTDLLQHLVNNYGGLAAGVHVTIWICGDSGESEYVYGSFISKDKGAPTQEPQLSIDWSSGSGEPTRSVSDSVAVAESVGILIYTGTLATYVVPAGVTKLSIEAWGMGQSGENGGVAYGGKGGGGGAYAQATVTVTPGETLTLFTGSYPNAIGADTAVYRDYGGPSQTLLVLAKAASLYNGGDAANSIGDEKYSGGVYDWPAENTYGMGGGGAADARWLAIGGQGKDGVGITGGPSWRVDYPGAGGDGGIQGVNGSNGGVAGGGGGGGKGTTTGGVGGSGLILICATPVIGTTAVSVVDVPTVSVEVPNTYTVSRSNLVSVTEASSLLISSVVCSQQDSVNAQEFVVVYVSGEVVVVNLTTSDGITVSESILVYVSAPPVLGVIVYVKVAGVWTAVAKVWVKDGGVWKESTSKVNVSGDWKP